MEKIVQWTDWDHEGREDCKLVQSEDGIRLEGVVTGTRNSTYQAHYLVRTDASLHTREVVVEYTNGPKLHIISDGEGNWKDHATGKTLSIFTRMSGRRHRGHACDEHTSHQTPWAAERTESGHHCLLRTAPEPNRGRVRGAKSRATLYLRGTGPVLLVRRYFQEFPSRSRSR